MSETTSKILLQQRVRNRIIDVLDLASSLEHIARFGTFEVIHRWEDWVPDPNSEFLAEPVFSEMEQAAIRRFHTAWDRCAEQKEEEIFDAQSLSELPHWRALRVAAESTLRLFDQRGRFSEEEEEFEIAAWRQRNEPIEGDR